MRAARGTGRHGHDLQQHGRKRPAAPAGAQARPPACVQASSGGSVAKRGARATGERAHPRPRGYRAETRASARCDRVRRDAAGPCSVLTAVACAGRADRELQGLGAGRRRQGDKCRGRWAMEGALPAPLLYAPLIYAPCLRPPPPACARVCARGRALKRASCAARGPGRGSRGAGAACFSSAQSTACSCLEMLLNVRWCVRTGCLLRASVWAK